MLVHHANSRHRGFTVTDLLVVVGLLLLLGVLILPSFLTRPTPGQVRCTSKLRQLAVVMRMYARDYDERFPQSGYTAGDQTVTLPSILHPYSKNARIWRCPQAGEHDDLRVSYDGSPGDTSVSFGYNWRALTRDGAGIPVSRVQDPTGTVVLVDSASYLAAPPSLLVAPNGTPPVYRHDGSANVAWADGHVGAAPRETLEATIAAEGGKATRDGIDRFRYWNLR